MRENVGEVWGCERRGVGFGWGRMRGGRGRGDEGMRFWFWEGIIYSQTPRNVRACVVFQKKYAHPFPSKSLAIP